MKKLMLFLCILLNSNKINANVVNGIHFDEFRKLTGHFLELETVLAKIEHFKCDGSIFLGNLHTSLNQKDKFLSENLHYVPISISQTKDTKCIVLFSEYKIFIFCFDAPSPIPNTQFTSLLYAPGNALENLYKRARNQHKMLTQRLSNHIADLSARCSASHSSQSLDDLDITILGHGNGGSCAQILGLILSMSHPQLLEQNRLRIITLGATFCFDEESASVYNTKLSSKSLHYVYETPPTRADNGAFSVATIIEGPEPLWTKYTLKSYKESVDLLTMDNFFLVLHEDTFLDKGRTETQ